MTEKPRETQAESHVVEFKEKVNNSSLMKHRLMLDYSRRIPINEVYDNLPMIEGYTKEDFFT